MSDTPEKAADAAPVSTPRRSMLPLAVAVVALGVAATQPLWVSRLYPVSAPVVDTSALEKNLADAQSRMSSMEQRLSALENAPAPVAPAAASVDLSPLENRLSALEAKPAVNTAALEAEVSRLRQQMGQASHGDDAQKVLLVATLQLVSAWQQGLPFEAPWLALTSAAASDQSLSVDLDDAAPTLLPFRDKGIPVLSRLVADYPAMAQQVVAAGTHPQGSWWQQSLERVKGLVVIRRQGEAVSADDAAADAILARAETKLSGGDLSAAVAEIEKLDDTSTQVAAEWLEAARARLLADSLASKLAQHAAGTLTAGTSAAGEVAP